jgi:hypothetical protein
MRLGGLVLLSYYKLIIHKYATVPYTCKILYCNIYIYEHPHTYLRTPLHTPTLTLSHCYLLVGVSEGGFVV